MNTVLISIASFIVAISVIVTIHELGHYLAARLLGCLLYTSDAADE